MRMNFYDVCLEDYKRLEDENDDSGRIQRAIDDCRHGVLYIPKGNYYISKMLKISNFCSVRMHKSAVLTACDKMDYVLFYDGGDGFINLISCGDDGEENEDYNVFIKGGVINGNGMASCLSINNYHHFTLKDITLLNGKNYGLKVGNRGHGYELIAANVYCKCTISGLAGNTGIATAESDSHYTDCIVIDYTTGFAVESGGSNRFTRCHVWGGIIPPVKEGEDCEMLKDSVAFSIRGDDTLLRDCYADTAKIGFKIMSDVTMSGCAYFNNYRFKLNDVTAVEHISGRLTVMQCRFSKTCPDFTVYNGDNKDLVWIGNVTPDVHTMYATGEKFDF